MWREIHYSDCALYFVQSSKYAIINSLFVIIVALIGSNMSLIQ